MKFSIVIPLYNKQDTIRRAINSVFDQIEIRKQAIQLIIVDDGSTDNSLTIVNRIQCENTHRDIIVYTQKNAGVSAARNKGIELASHNLIAFLDADDTYEPHFLDEITQLVNNYPIAGVFCTGYRFINTGHGTKRNAKLIGLVANNEQQILADFFYSAATGDLPITSSSVCIRKSALQKIRGFPNAENMGEDQAAWSQLALSQMIAISQRICANYFEDTSNSLMQTITPSKEMPFSQRLQRQLEGGLIPEQEIKSVKEYIAGHLLDLVRRNIASGDLEAAKNLIVDQRSRCQFKRWVYWSLRLQAQIILSKINGTPPIYNRGYK